MAQSCTGTLADSVADISQRGYLGVLAGGAALFGVLTFSRTDRIAELLGSDRETVQELGVRDLGSAALLLGALRGAVDPRLAIGLRLAYDVGNVVVYRRRPKVAAMAFGFAAIGVLALRAR